MRSKKIINFLLLFTLSFSAIVQAEHHSWVKLTMGIIGFAGIITTLFKKDIQIISWGIKLSQEPEFKKTSQKITFNFSDAWHMHQRMRNSKIKSYDQVRNAFRLFNRAPLAQKEFKRNYQELSTKIENAHVTQSLKKSFASISNNFQNNINNLRSLTTSPTQELSPAYLSAIEDGSSNMCNSRKKQA